MTRIVATRTDERWGYRKGDVLEIVRHGNDGNVVVAKNVSAPHHYGRRNAIIHRSEYLFEDEKTSSFVWSIYGVMVASYVFGVLVGWWIAS